eukprot:3378241-Rhodomonas_salina.2
MDSALAHPHSRRCHLNVYCQHRRPVGGTTDWFCSQLRCIETDPKESARGIIIRPGQQRLARLGFKARRNRSKSRYQLLRKGVRCVAREVSRICFDRPCVAAQLSTVQGASTGVVIVLLACTTRA